MLYPEGTFTIREEDDSLIVQGTSKVTVSGVIQFIRDGDVVCSIDAVVDFATIPPEMHDLAISCLMRFRTSVHLQSVVRPVPALVPPSSPASPGSPVESRRSIWSILKGILRG